MPLRTFVSVGTHPQQFDRLLRELDKLAEDGKVNAEIFAQIGNSSFEPENFRFEKFVKEERYNEEMEKAGIVISHGGAGTIINALRLGKKVVVVPRLKKFGEHTNDHQLDLAMAVEKVGKVIAVYNIEELGEKIKEAENFKPSTESSRKALIERIKKFIGEFE